MRERAFVNDHMPFSRCAESCEGYAFYGVQARHWCWCGNTAPPAAKKRDEGECHKQCPGDSNSKCGYQWRMNIYQLELGKSRILYSSGSEWLPQWTIFSHFTAEACYIEEGWQYWSNNSQTLNDPENPGIVYLDSATECKQYCEDTFPSRDQ